MPFHKDLVGADLHESKIPTLDNSNVEKVNSPGKQLKEGSNISLTVESGTKSIIVAVSKILPTGDVVGTTDTQTLTNKTIDFSSNTLTNVVSTNTSQSLTNKTLDDSSNIIRATSLATTTSPVVVSAAVSPGVGQVLTATSATTANWQNPGGAGSGHVIQDEGVSLTPQRLFLNFVGTGVTVTDGGAGPNSTIVTVPGVSVQDEGVDLTQRAKINFVGGLITATDSGSVTNVTIASWKEDKFVASGSAVFTLSFTPADSQGLFAYINGLFRTQGISEDYTISGNVVTFNFTPTTGNIVAFKYQH